MYHTGYHTRDTSVKLYSFSTCFQEGVIYMYVPVFVWKVIRIYFSRPQIALYPTHLKKSCSPDPSPNFVFLLRSKRIFF